MDYKLTVKNGDVEVIFKSGSDYVRTAYSESKCKAVISASKKAEPSEYEGYISIDGGNLLIAGTIEKAEIKPTKTSTSKKTTNAKKKA